MAAMRKPLPVLILTALLAGCGTMPQARSEFEDIPVPRGLEYRPSMSTVIESPSVKAAKVIYRGRLEPTSLATVMRAMMESNGWRHVGTTAASGATAQIFEKGDTSVQVRIWEGWWYTYLELTGGRALSVQR
jgi:hypothetical protein